MKKAIIILTIIFPLTASAKFGWSFTDYSLMGGQQYRLGVRPLWGLDFQYDRYRSSCLIHKRYFGIGANYYFNPSYNEIGVKCMWNPTRITIMISRTVKFYPYLYGQGNYMLTSRLNNISIDNKYINGISIRPGIGLTGNIREDKIVNVRTYLQLGYNIPIDYVQSFDKSLTLEFKVGISINSRELKRNKQHEEENKQSETQ